MKDIKKLATLRDAIDAAIDAESALIVATQEVDRLILELSKDSQEPPRHSVGDLISGDALYEFEVAAVTLGKDGWQYRSTSGHAYVYDEHDRLKRVTHG